MCVFVQGRREENGVEDGVTFPHRFTQHVPNVWCN